MRHFALRENFLTFCPVKGVSEGEPVDCNFPALVLSFLATFMRKINLQANKTTEDVFTEGVDQTHRAVDAELSKTMGAAKSEAAK